MFNIEETNNNQQIQNKEINEQLENMSEEELEQLKLRLQQIKKRKEKEREEKKEFTEKEISWRFEYFIMQKSKELRKTIPAYILVIALFITFVLIQILQDGASVLYPIGFSFLFVLGLTVYIIVTTKEIKQLKKGLEKPMENIHLVVKEKTWYEMEYDKLSDEEKEERRKLYFSTFNTIFANYKRKKK